MSDEQTSIKGIHHITIICGDAARNAHFYLTTLGLHFAKKTVNFDAPEVYHLYYGDSTGTPGTVVTFFPWVNSAPGLPGIGTTHHFALRVDSFDALLKWKTWLQHRRVLVAGPYDHGAYRSIVFDDPDGVQLEIAAPGTSAQGSDSYLPLEDGLQAHPESQDLSRETWGEPVTEIQPDMRLGPIHHITPIAEDLARTDAFYQEVLNMPLANKMLTADAEQAQHWFWRTSEEGGSFISYICRDIHHREGPHPRGKIGRGVTHHFAFEVADDEGLNYWQEHLRGKGVAVTEVRDRKYFRSIYFNDPDGHILEIATTVPGFLVDQDEDRLGKDLALPGWLEPRRAEIERVLPPLNV